jgi:tetratricopeptide (TPR) repeat protein
LSGDKGQVREEELRGRAEPRFTPHGGCFSLPVNYHALGEVVRRRGGQMLSPPRHFHLAVSAFLLGDSPTDWGETSLAFDEAIVQNGPDHFFPLKKGLEKLYAQLDAEQVLAWLRLSGWDARVFLECADALEAAAAGVGEPLRQELVRAIAQVWEGYYSIGEKADLPFRLARVLVALGRHADALAYFRRSLELHGPAAWTWCCLALCHQQLRQLDEALACVAQALELEPDLEPAQALRSNLQADATQQATAADCLLVSPPAASEATGKHHQS